jgi:hypothetical protein
MSGLEFTTGILLAGRDDGAAELGPLQNQKAAEDRLYIAQL